MWSLRWMQSATRGSRKSGSAQPAENGLAGQLTFGPSSRDAALEPGWAQVSHSCQRVRRRRVRPATPISRKFICSRCPEAKRSGSPASITEWMHSNGRPRAIGWCASARPRTNPSRPDRALPMYGTTLPSVNKFNDTGWYDDPPQPSVCRRCEDGQRQSDYVGRRSQRYGPAVVAGRKTGLPLQPRTLPGPRS